MTPPPVALPGAPRPAERMSADNQPCYVLPVSWRDHQSRVLITLQAQSVHHAAPDAT